MADELVRTFYGAAADVVSAPLGSTIVESVFVFCQILERGLNLLLCFRRGWVHAFHSSQDMGLLTMEEARERGIDPFLRPESSFPVLGIGHPVDILGTMIIVEHLLGCGEDLLAAVPNPGVNLNKRH